MNSESLFISHKIARITGLIGYVIYSANTFVYFIINSLYVVLLSTGLIKESGLRHTRPMSVGKFTRFPRVLNFYWYANFMVMIHIIGEVKNKNRFFQLLTHPHWRISRNVKSHWITIIMFTWMTEQLYQTVLFKKKKNSFSNVKIFIFGTTRYYSFFKLNVLVGICGQSGILWTKFNRLYFL